MRYAKKTMEYELNMEAFHEMDRFAPMTSYERKALKEWAKKGYDINTNPWDCTSSDGLPLPFLQAYRLENGYSYGPWDWWKGPEYELCWQSATKCFNTNELF